MVGSELPTPETRETTVTDVVELERTGADRAGLERPRAASSDVSLTIHRGEVVGIAGVEGNGQTELIACAHGIDQARGPARCRCSADRHHPGAPLANVATSGSATSRRTVRTTGLVLDATAVGERDARTPDAKIRTATESGSTARAPRARTDQIVREFDVRTPGTDVAGDRALGRQPAEDHRRTRDDRRSRRC